MDMINIDDQWLGDFEAVGEFHSKFGLDSVNEHGPDPHTLPTQVEQFRLKFLREELAELETAMSEEDLPKIADALVDLVYVALGTAHLYGLPWNELFWAVQQANMAKERAKADGSNSTRGSSLDVVKPEGWQPPDIEAILRRHGWSPK